MGRGERVGRENERETETETERWEAEKGKTDRTGIERDRAKVKTSPVTRRWMDGRTIEAPIREGRMGGKILAATFRRGGPRLECCRQCRVGSWAGVSIEGREGGRGRVPLPPSEQGSVRDQGWAGPALRCACVRARACVCAGAGARGCVCKPTTVPVPSGWAWSTAWLATRIDRRIKGGRDPPYSSNERVKLRSNRGPIAIQLRSDCGSIAVQGETPPS
jgi:hypothetical protein